MRQHVGDATFGTQAIIGSYVVLFGMTVNEKELAGFRGFAIERTDHTENEHYFLKNMLCFEQNEISAVDMPLYSCFENPIQAFLWGDYTAKPLHEYTYKIHAMYGSAKNLKPRWALTFDKVTTAGPGGAGEHEVYFNRGVAASQAYVRKFGYASPADDEAAMVWLSRGLHEALLAFINSAKGERYALHASVYEFQYPDVLDAFKAAAKAGAEVNIVYDAVAKKPTKAANVRAIKAARITRLTIPRTNTKYIAHNKFIVLSMDGKPMEVWTGSTNMTEGGIFGHSNVGHRVRDPELAQQYFQYWQALAADPDAPTLKDWTEEHSPLPGNRWPPLTPIFSPRPTTEAMDVYAARFDVKPRDADDHDHACFFTAPFGVDKRLRAVMEKRRPYLRYIIEDTGRNGVEVTIRNPNNRITVGAFVPKGGYARWWKRERLTGFNKHATYIHTKYMIIDPLRASSTLITGSANFSDASINRNDENAVLIVDNDEVNDLYLTEFMRLFTHFAFRAAVKKNEQNDKTADVIYLQDNDRWYRRFYRAGAPECLERLYFSQ
jgi:phosphatidylserine/phosphatidylglycerophosphate/cardiolipin synthase-like enzyme